MRQELRRFPVLVPKSRLDSDTVLDFTHEFFVDKLAALTAGLLAEAIDDDAIGRISRTWMRRWLISRARKTGAGAVRRKVEELLSEEDAFERVPPGRPGAGDWQLAGPPVGPWDGDDTKMIAAARQVRVTPLVQWKSDTRQGPVASRADLLAVLVAIMEAAGGSIGVAELSHAFGQRFPAWRDPFEISSDQAAGDDADGPAKPMSADPLVQDEAADIFRDLSPIDRKLVLCLADQNVDLVQTELGCGRSSAYNRLKALRLRIFDLVADSDDPYAIALNLGDMCRQWAHSMDIRVGAASENGEDTPGRPGEETR